MAPKVAVTQAPALNPIELRLGGGMMALNRLITTFQSKRMPVAGLTVGRDGGRVRATVLLDCPHETARRYAALLSGLEDVEGIEVPEQTVEVALVKTNGEGWREPASRAGVTGHVAEPGGTVGAAGEPGKGEAWLGSLGG